MERFFLVPVLAGLVLGWFFPALAVFKPYFIAPLMGILFLTVLRMETGPLFEYLVSRWKLVLLQLLFFLVVLPASLLFLFNPFDPFLALYAFLFFLLPMGMINPLMAHLYDIDAKNRCC